MSTELATKPKGSFLKSVLSYSVNLLSFWSTKVDSKTLEIQERAKEEIDIKLLRVEFKNKSNIQLQKVYDQYVMVLKDVKLKTNAIESDSKKLQGLGLAINRIEKESVVQTGDDWADRQAEKSHKWKIQNLRLEAKSLLSEISYNKQHITNQQGIAEQLYDQYQKNKYRTNEALNQLKTLEYRNTLAESRQSIEEIQLGDSNFTLLEIVQIVEEKEATIEAKSLADQVLLTGGRTVYDDVLEEHNSMIMDDELTKYLIGLENGETNINVGGMQKNIDDQLKDVHVVN